MTELSTAGTIQMISMAVAALGAAYMAFVRYDVDHTTETALWIIVILAAAIFIQGIK